MARENLFVELLGKIRPKGEWELARSRLGSECRRNNRSQGYKKTDGWVKQGLGHVGSWKEVGFFFFFSYLSAMGSY